MKIEILSFNRSSKINIKEPAKQTSRIIQNFNFIIAEWKLENKRFQNNRNKTEQQTKESSNFLFTLKILSIKFKVSSSNKILRNTLLFTQYRQPANQIKQYQKYYESFSYKTKQSDQPIYIQVNIWIQMFYIIKAAPRLSSI